MRAFELDPRLERDSRSVARLGLCDMRLMNDSRWPWLILVPQRGGLVEFHDLTPLDQTLLTFETGLVSKALKQTTGADKINIAAIGNVVAMFHLHIVARSAGDPNWPRPIWGYGEAVPYADDAAESLADSIRRVALPV